MDTHIQPLINKFTRSLFMTVIKHKLPHSAICACKSTQNCTHQSLFQCSISRQIQWSLHHTGHRFNESLLSTSRLKVSCVPELRVTIWMIEGQELKWANLVHKTVCYLQYFSLRPLRYVLVAIFTADISRHVFQVCYQPFQYVTDWVHDTIHTTCVCMVLKRP